VTERRVRIKKMEMKKRGSRIALEKVRKKWRRELHCSLSARVVVLFFVFLF